MFTHKYIYNKYIPDNNYIIYCTRRHEDIRTAIYSFAHSLRDNVDKLERHERREKQSGDQMQNLLLTIVNKQREQFTDHKTLEAVIKELGYSVDVLVNAEKEEVNDKIYN